LAWSGVREFNKSKKAVIYWVDEEDIGKLSNLGGDVRAVPLEREYIYDPRIYRSLSGKEKHHIRKASIGCSQGMIWKSGTSRRGY